MTSRRALTSVPLVAVAALLLSACGSGGSGQASGGGSDSSAPSTSAAPATPTDAVGLATLMKQGAAALKTAHLDMAIDAAGTTITATGDEKLAGGKLQALDLSEQLATAGTIRLVILDGKTYAQLPASMGASSKPWVLVTTNTTNPVVAQLASTLQSVQQSASLDQFTVFTQAASAVVPKGAEQVGGVQATHYAVTVDVTKMPATQEGKQQLIDAGLSTLPVDLWVDGKGRPVKLTEQLTVQNQTVSTTVTLSRFDEPVTITAPPADQVETG